MRLAIFIHLILIALASTGFTAITSFTSGQPFQWTYYQYGMESGFGAEYQSPYSVQVVLTYLAAFAFGTVGFAWAIGRGHPLVGLLGLILSLAGLASFGIEASHWFSAHQRTWMVSSPAAMLVLSLMALMPHCCHGKKVVAQQPVTPTA